jgi:hypothetical protein
MHEIVGEMLASRHPEVEVGSHVVGCANRSDGLAEFVVTDGEQVNTFDETFDPRTAVLIQSVARILAALKEGDGTGTVGDGARSRPDRTAVGARGRTVRC